jgi:hypothetical protein
MKKNSEKLLTIVFEYDTLIMGIEKHIKRGRRK